MIITLLFAALIISAIIVFVYLEHEYCDGDNPYTFFAGILGTIGLVACIILILDTHVGVDNQIEVAKIQKESIERRYDILNNEYEDISSVSVLQEVEEWNKSVVSNRYWCNHPMTSWFYSKDFVKSLELIDTTK